MEPSRNRFEAREIEVYDDFYNVNKDKFFALKEFVKVTRTTYWKNSDKYSLEISFYILSKKNVSKRV